MFSGVVVDAVVVSVVKKNVVVVFGGIVDVPFPVNIKKYSVQS